MLDSILPRLFCLATGLALGGLLPGVTAEREERPYPWQALIRAAGESLWTLLACLLCGLALPERAQTAMLYAGLGAVGGACWPLRTALRHAPWPWQGLTAVCVWISLCLPFTGVLCCLAGLALTLLWGRAPLAMIAVPLLAVPVALIQFGPENALLAGAAALVVAGRRLPWPHIPHPQP